MKRTLTALVALILIICTDIPAYSQGTEWETLNDEVMSLYRQGRYDRAVVVAKKALQVAEQAVGPNHPAVATSLNNLAGLHRAQGQYAQAEPLYKRALAIDEKAYGPHHPDVATDLGTLGGTHTSAIAMNNRGQVVGFAQTAGGEEHAFVWENGVITDLGTLGSSSRAEAINERGQIVGTDRGYAVLWSR